MRRERTLPDVFSASDLRRTGLTLLEILLALGVIAILATLAWPSVMRLHGEQQIVDSAEKVRALVATARVHAIESGLAYQFRYEIGGNHFLVIPFEKEFEGIDTRTQGAGTAEGLGRFSKAGGNLPEGVTFAKSKDSSSVSTIGAGQQLSSDALNGLPGADKLSGLSWSGPVIFQPDGSSTDVEFSVVDRRNQRIALRVRGITGAVAAGRLQLEDRP
jgi:prepilin-type N-terminal cleavage/methylation domain-containing protein